MGVCDGARLARSLYVALVVNRPTRAMGIVPPSSVDSGDSLSSFGSDEDSACMRYLACDDKPHILIVSPSGGSWDANAMARWRPSVSASLSPRVLPFHVFCCCWRNQAVMGE